MWYIGFSCVHTPLASPMCVAIGEKINFESFLICFVFLFSFLKPYTIVLSRRLIEDIHTNHYQNMSFY